MIALSTTGGECAVLLAMLLQSFKPFVLKDKRTFSKALNNDNLVSIHPLGVYCISVNHVVCMCAVNIFIEFPP